MKLLNRLLMYRPDMVTLLFIAFMAYLWVRPPARVIDLDERARDFSYVTLDGQTSQLRSLRGRVTLVSFWATWCPYCRKELPDIQTFYHGYRDRGFEVIALSTDDRVSTVAKFVEDAGYDFPVAMATKEHHRAFDGIDVLPTSFIIDKHGLIRHKVVGQLSYERLKDLVTPLILE